MDDLATAKLWAKLRKPSQVSVVDSPILTSGPKRTCLRASPRSPCRMTKGRDYVLPIASNTQSRDRAAHSRRFHLLQHHVPRLSRLASAGQLLLQVDDRPIPSHLASLILVAQWNRQGNSYRTRVALPHPGDVDNAQSMVSGAGPEADAVMILLTTAGIASIPQDTRLRSL